MATVTKIPATVSRYTATPIQTRVRRKVAAYARVSTDHEDQLNSYEAQCDYYTTYIQANDEWEFAGVYSDEGISGTSTRRRDGFNRMVEDALAGRIGLILTKSVSRFARNTVDSLTTIRKLKEHGTEVYFEKENIWTFDSKGELLLTIMSSLAQEESRSISLNVTWGQRKRFADGKATAPFSVFLGYDRGENGEFVINPEQAEIVKIIYDAAVIRYEATKAEREKVAADIRQRSIRRREFERFITELEKLPIAVSEFDETLWGSLVEYVTVGKDKTMVLTRLGGTEIGA